MNKEKIKLIITGVVLALGISVGFYPEFNAFFRYFILSIIGIGSLYWWLTRKKREDDRVIILEKMLEDADHGMAEMEEVIQHYEGLLDTMSIKLPCICGGNTFEGLFPAGQENMVECQKCGSKYKVLVSFDSVLISEPLEDLNINKLIENNL
jgi:hypothetical protein